MAGSDGKILMTRGGNAELVDTRTGLGVPVKPAVGTGWTDGSGTVRITGINGSDDGGMLNGISTFWYRLPGGTERKLFSHVDADGNGLYPAAVDGTHNLAYPGKLGSLKLGIPSERVVLSASGRFRPGCCSSQQRTLGLQAVRTDPGWARRQVVICGTSAYRSSMSAKGRDLMEACL